MIQKVMVLTVGAVAVSDLGSAWRRRWAARRPRADWPGIRVAIVAHVYYPELLDEIRACQQLLPAGTPLHITVPPERSGLVREALQGSEHVMIHEYENRGRDIAPFLALLSSGALDGYDAVLKLHTKRSPHLLDGEIRRKLLFDSLCGDWNRVCMTLSAFTSPSTAIMGWRQSWRATPSYWMANELRTRELATRMHIPRENVRLGFFEGSMFWFRPAALLALRELDLRPSEFDQEDRQLDNTLHHAVERCFTLAAWSRGYSVCDLRGRVL